MITDPVLERGLAHLGRVVRGSQRAAMRAFWSCDFGRAWSGRCMQPNEIPVLGLRLSLTLPCNDAGGVVR